METMPSSKGKETTTLSNADRALQDLGQWLLTVSGLSVHRTQCKHKSEHLVSGHHIQSFWCKTL